MHYAILPKTSSNSRSKRERKNAMEERGNVTMHTLSPSMHSLPIDPACVRGHAEPPPKLLSRCSTSSAIPIVERGCPYLSCSAPNHHCSMPRSSVPPHRGARLSIEAADDRQGRLRRPLRPPSPPGMWPPGTATPMTSALSRLWPCLWSMPSWPPVCFALRCWR
jgi:hypothetical protein